MAGSAMAVTGIQKGIALKLTLTLSPAKHNEIGMQKQTQYSARTHRKPIMGSQALVINGTITIIETDNRIADKTKFLCWFVKRIMVPF
jgi:hypothetical protein